jgi:hypothetical protein
MVVREGERREEKRRERGGGGEGAAADRPPPTVSLAAAWRARGCWALALSLSFSS